MLTSIIKTLQDIDQPVPIYMLKALVCAIVPSLVISLSLNFLLLPEQQVPLDILKPGILVSVVLVAPIVETAILWLILAGLQRWTKLSLVQCALASALIWALFHGLQVPIWGATIFIPFFVFSLCFLSWRKRSLVAAMLMTTSVHALQNALASGYLWISSH